MPLKRAKNLSAAHRQPHPDRQGRLQQSLRRSTLRGVEIDRRIRPEQRGPVYAFGNDPPARFLAELTEQTGGRYFAVGDHAVALAESAARIGVGLRNPYELEIRPATQLTMATIAL